MEKATEYRDIASKLKLEAEKAALPQVRRLKLAAASRWEALALEIELVVAPTAFGTRPTGVY